MKTNYTHMAVLLDRSGSMKSIANDMIGGFNKFLEDQQQVEGEATLTLAQFDHAYETIYQMVPLNQVQPLTSVTFVPRGSTALNDSFARLIITTGEDLAKMPEDQRPEKVVILVITDGGENASVEYLDSQKVKDLTKHQEEVYNWQFVYIGANQDAFSVGSNVGVSNSANFNATTKGVSNMYAAVSSNLSFYRSSSNLSMDALIIEED